MDEAATEFVTMMKNIWAAFPDLAGKDLYMTGESYAGKYIPRFSWALVEDGTFNLKASLVGDPYTAPLTQRTHTYLVPEALNIIDDSNMPQIAAL
jgi:carboxypeptidase C (cathepsin A)